MKKNQKVRKAQEPEMLEPPALTALVERAQAEAGLPAGEAELDRIETDDAEAMLQQLARNPTDKLRIAKSYLRLAWSHGWRAAGGPAGHE